MLQLFDRYRDQVAARSLFQSGLHVRNIPGRDLDMTKLAALLPHEVNVASLVIMAEPRRGRQRFSGI